MTSTRHPTTLYQRFIRRTDRASAKGVSVVRYTASLCLEIWGFFIMIWHVMDMPASNLLDLVCKYSQLTGTSGPTTSNASHPSAEVI